MELSDPISVIKGVGPAMAATLQRQGLNTVADVIDYYPRKYNDFSKITNIASLKPGAVTIEATISGSQGRYVRRGMHITEAVATDSSGSIRLVWFNQPYRSSAIKPNQKYYISGEFALSHQKFAILNPACELASDFPLNTARIVPVYRESKGLTSNQMRKIVAATVNLLRNLPETLPAEIVTSQQLLSRAEAIYGVHFPKNAHHLERAKKRLGFEEVFELSLAALLNKRTNALESSLLIPFDVSLARQFTAKLPFVLTDDQRRVIWQIYQDMAANQPMNRLIEGDVGSGKTVVATMAALMVIKQGLQVAIMSPTELLARQHADTVYDMLHHLGYDKSVVLLVGGMSNKQKQEARQRIADGTAKLIIGTHALIQEKVDMRRLALVIIDEQHRFGVEQRKSLMKKAGHAPHIMTMTATPIPRSLALTLYGELDISIIHNRPSNRLPIETQIVSPNSQASLHKKIDEQIESGRQVFVVCPLVRESDVLPAAAAEETYRKLANGPYKHRRVGLLHGQLPAAQKNQIMQDFAKGDIDVLVSTTVVEVGVDVPNATVMIIQNADRFGLAQLHQLRGRVGRSSHQGFCYLVLSDSKAPSKRLKALETTNDGFRLAELDLELRGPGAIYGTLQHGALDLRIAKLTDTALIASARQCAQQTIESGLDLLKYKHLYERVSRLRAITNLN